MEQEGQPSSFREQHPSSTSPSPGIPSGLRHPTEAKAMSETHNDSTDSPASDIDDEIRLNNLLATTKDQDQLERDIGVQADKLLVDQADERDRKRLGKTEAQRQRYVADLRSYERQLSGPGGSTVKNKIRADKARVEALIKTLDTEIDQIQARIADRHKVDEVAYEQADDAGNRRLPNETRREFLIRTGKITPFSKFGTSKPSANLADVMLDAEQETNRDEDISAYEAAIGPKSHVNLKRPGFLDEEVSAVSSAAEEPERRASKRRRIENAVDMECRSISISSDDKATDDDFVPDLDDRQLAALGQSEEEIEQTSDDDFALITPGKKKVKAAKSIKASKRTKRIRASDESEEEEEDLAGVDDGDENFYQARIKSWSRRRRATRLKKQNQQSVAIDEDETIDAVPSSSPANDNQTAEWYQPHPSYPDTELDGGLRIPGDIWPALFDYQKTGVRWLWELYQQRVGGIVGDEMGLGKTIQVIALLASLHHSKKLTRPVIVVAPATVMKQWVNEFHRWWPALRVSILHTSGSGMMNVRRESQLEEDLECNLWKDEDEMLKPRRSKTHDKAARRIVDRVFRDGHVLVTTYSGLQTYRDLLIQKHWEYAVLDEGHKIRNPNTAITLWCKMLRTHNRIILSGTPIQNNLTELWSLFDFVFPMRLGNLVTFRQQFEFPIKQGGYANASNLQVETAAQCAEKLKDAISPYLLQRFKIDVAQDLPKKTERIMFCKLTRLQREAYQHWLDGEERSRIDQGKLNVLYGVDILRKVCNHPDLCDHKTIANKPGHDYGKPSKSGKMQVVRELLQIWKRRGHKALLFAQHRIMLDILEKMVRKMDGIKYLRMDGNTNIQDRQNLVDEFNDNNDINVFLLTTKVGGLGVNLTGADRVIIYDPDWNPSTDAQARERAWRLGQKKEVEIYRLMTAGTIEEKIYHRQVFKQFLTNKILRDPKSRQNFQFKDLYDLFSLGSPDDETETGTIFKDSRIHFEEQKGTAPATNGAMDAGDEVRAELNSIRGIQHQEDVHPTDEEKATPADGKDKDKSDRLLSSIFDRAGVHSVHEHDAIINPSTGKKKIQADPEVIREHARKMANRAARELKRAREIAQNVRAGQVTWTGLHGTTGRPEEPPRARSSRGGLGRSTRGGVSSSSLLSSLSHRQALANDAARNTPSASSSREGTPRPNRPQGANFMKMIRDYIKLHGGAVYTQMLIDHFNHLCGTPQRTADFTEMLKTVANLDKGPRGTGRGRWVLKDEWKD